MKAVILAGGEGRRLRPYTKIIPKPLLPVKDRSVLDIILEKLKNQGIRDIILATNYKAYLFETLFGDGSKIGMNISYSKESKALGTAGPLRNLDERVGEDFFVMNGDLITDLDIKNVERFHKERGASITIVTRKIETPIDYGVIKVKGDRVITWNEKPKIRSEISTGMYMINPSVLKYIPKNEFYGMDRLVKKVINNDEKVSRFLYNGKWVDIGKIEDFKRVNMT